MDYEAVIGLETHVQLKTKSKMWCGCANDFGAPPNTHVCPVCLGMPGVLPVANEEALRLTALTGLLLNCSLPPRAKFDRKSYFYPDMPKNYQITQYDMPSTANGFVEFEFDGPSQLRGLNGFPMVLITRAHLEEDVGKSFHFDRQSGLDFNRAGVPLLEIVSEPNITSADMAYAYLNALKDILRHFDDDNPEIGRVSYCDMEEGMMRCDVNVSVHPKGSKELGAKIEIKNMNSFSGVRRALEYEIPRQIEVIKKGGKLIQSTRRWDDVVGITEEMRTKENAHDYRYLPDPDLMPLKLTDQWLAQVRSRVWELPLARKRRFRRDYDLPDYDAEAFKMSQEYGDYFEQTAKKTKFKKALANWIINGVRTEIRRQIMLSYANSQGTYITKVADLRFSQEQLVEHVELEATEKISHSTALQVFAEMFQTGKSPGAIVEEKGLSQVSDTSAIEALCDQAIAANPGPVADFKAGKVAALNSLKGHVMKLSNRKANLALAGEILERKLKG